MPKFCLAWKNHHLHRRFGIGLSSVVMPWEHMPRRINCFMPWLPTSHWARFCACSALPASLFPAIEGQFTNERDRGVLCYHCHCHCLLPPLPFSKGRRQNFSHVITTALLTLKAERRKGRRRERRLQERATHAHSLYAFFSSLFSNVPQAERDMRKTGHRDRHRGTSL